MQRPRCSAKCPYTCRLIVAPGRSRSITAVVVVVIVFPSVACSVIAGIREALAEARPASGRGAVAPGRERDRCHRVLVAELGGGVRAVEAVRRVDHAAPQDELLDTVRDGGLDVALLPGCQPTTDKAHGRDRQRP